MSGLHCAGMERRRIEINGRLNMKSLKLICTAFAALGVYLSTFGGDLMYTGREYGIALLALAVTAYWGGKYE